MTKRDEELLLRTHYLAILQVDGAVGGAGKGLVVGDDDEGLTQTVAQVEEELVKFLLVMAVQTARRLVGQHYGRVVDEGTGHGHALLLAARQLARLMRLAVAKPHELQHLTGFGLCLASALTGDESGNHDIFQGCEFRQQLMELEDKADVTVAEGGELPLLQAGDLHTVNLHCS